MYAGLLQDDTCFPLSLTLLAGPSVFVRFGSDDISRPICDASSARLVRLGELELIQARRDWPLYLAGNHHHQARLPISPPPSPIMPSPSPRPLTLIVAATASNGIGLNGGLPWRLPEEMKYFAKGQPACIPSSYMRSLLTS